MKRKIAISVSLFLFAASICSAEIVDRIVAVVNDEPITKGELDAHFAPIYQQFNQSYHGRDLTTRLDEARANVLEQLIQDKLIYQESIRQGIRVQEEEIDKRMEEMARSFGEEGDFVSKLREQGLTRREMRDRIKEQIAIAKIRKFQILGRILVSPQDVEEYYEKNISQFTTPERVKVSTIMLRKKPDEEPVETTAERIETLIAQFEAGESFATLAEQNSDESHANMGGDLGFVEKGEMVRDIDDAIFKTPVGQLTPIVESEIGYHVFLVEAKQEASQVSLDDEREKIRTTIFRERSEERLKAWIEELKENAYISIK